LHSDNQQIKISGLDWQGNYNVLGLLSLFHVTGKISGRGFYIEVNVWTGHRTPGNYLIILMNVRSNPKSLLLCQ
jgi:hypothetical protein